MFAVIICAAGASARMGKGIKKEYCLLHDGLTVLGAAVCAFGKFPEIKEIVITVPDDPQTGEAAAREALRSLPLFGERSMTIHFVSGGQTRQASVFNALSLLADYNPDYVLIHDGARPFVSHTLIARIIAGVKQHHAIIPLLPLTETPKETDEPLNDSNTVLIQRHPRRALTAAAQTPQAFSFSGIFAAHKKAIEGNSAAIEFTDDAEIWASFNGPVAAILGRSENKKITHPEDLFPGNKEILENSDLNKRGVRC